MIPTLNPQLPTLNRGSAQRESNPHVRHGEAAGIRYIMGAFVRVELSKNDLQSTGPPYRAVPGLEPTSPHYGCGVFAAGPPVRAAQSKVEG